MNKATVITINYYSEDLIHKMEDLLRGIDSIELVVVDNSGEFEASHRKTTVLKTNCNIGFGRACNLGAERANTGILVFLNPDADISDITLLALIAAAPSDDHSAIWGPVIRDRRGLIPTLKRPGRFGLEYRRVYMELSNEDNEKLKTLYVSGACMAIGTDLFQKLGGFCDDIFLYGEDLDLSLRAANSDADVYICQNLSISHAGGESSSKLDARLKRMMRSIGGHYVLMRRQPVSRLRALVNAIHLASGIRI